MGTISVMLVDDEAWVLDDLRTLIDWEKAGFSITATAKNGKQALKKYREQFPQIIITDIQMPLMDGVELAKALRNMTPTPIILFLTSYSDFNYAKQAFQYGIDDYLLKNEISESVLLQKLSLLRSKIEQSHHIQNLLSREWITRLVKQSDPASPAQGDLQPSQIRPAFFAFLEEDAPCPFLVSSPSNRTQKRMWQLSQFCLTQLPDADILFCCDIDPSHLLIGIAPAASSIEVASRHFSNHIIHLLSTLRGHTGSSFTALTYPTDFWRGTSKCGRAVHWFDEYSGHRLSDIPHLYHFDYIDSAWNRILPVFPHLFRPKNAYDHSKPPAGDGNGHQYRFC